MSEKKDWTIMIYMSADNNLSVDMAYALENIKNTAKNRDADVNLLVYYDGYSPAIPTLYCDFTDFENPVYFRSFKVQDKLYSVEEAFDENSASEFSVLNFVDWCVNKVEHKNGRGRKASNYGLIFSGHSFGFQGIGLLKDESSDYSMSMEKVNWLLGRITNSEEELKENAGEKPSEDIAKWESDQEVIIGQKLGILGFDSCVMSMLEVGHQFKAFANTMVASEGSVPNAGWAYTEILGNLANCSKHADVCEIAESFVKEFIRNQDSFTLGGSSVDMSAWDLRKLDILNAPFADLSKRLLECFEDENSTIYRQMKRVLLQVHRDCQSYMLEQNVDLGDFCELLKAETESLKSELGSDLHNQLDSIRDACDAVLEQLQECVLLAGFSGGKYQFSNGISLFFPWSISGYNVSRKDYEGLNFIKETEAGSLWKEFLVKYLGEVSFRQSIANHAGKEKLTYYSYVYEDADYSDNISFEGGEKMMDNSANKMMDNSANKMMDNSANKMMDNSANKMMDNSANKMMDNSANKMMDNSANKMMDNSANKMMDNSANKMMDNSANKMMDNSANKMMDNSANKMIDNSANKMGGGTSQFLDFFMQFNNIETPWNISGFTKEQQERSKAMPERSRTIKSIEDSEF